MGQPEPLNILHELRSLPLIIVNDYFHVKLRGGQQEGQQHLTRLGNLSNLCEQ